MTDVNEEIVKAYYEAKGYIVKTNHYYIKNGNSKTGRKTGGPSDIDLIIHHPIKKNNAIISVKGWHNDSITSKNLEKKWKKKEYDKLKIDRRTINAAKDFFGDKNFEKILVLPYFENEKLREDLRKFYEYEEILDFRTIIMNLIDGDKKDMKPFNIQKNYKDSEFLQTIRLLIKYYLKGVKYAKENRN